MDASKRPWQGAGGGPPAKRGGPAGGGSGSGAVDDELAEQAAFGAEPDDVDEDEDTRLQTADIDVDLGEAGRNWERPPPPPLDPRAASVSASPCRERCVIGCCGREGCLEKMLATPSCKRAILLSSFAQEAAVQVSLAETRGVPALLTSHSSVTRDVLRRCCPCTLSTEP